MPVISRFLGIVIVMLYRDHEPPHFHATYGEFEIMVGITDGLVTVVSRAGHWCMCSNGGNFISRSFWQTGHERGRSCRSSRFPHWNSDVASRGVFVLHVVDLRVLQDFRLWLRFNDGIEGIADLAHSLDGAVFEPLRDRAAFAHARLDPELHTVAWANGADLAPEYLHALVTAASPSGRFRP